MTIADTIPCPLTPDPDNNVIAKFDLDCGHHEAAEKMAEALKLHYTAHYTVVVSGANLHVIYKRYSDQDEANLLFVIDNMMREPQQYYIPLETAQAWAKWYHSLKRLGSEAYLYGIPYNPKTWRVTNDDAESIEFTIRVGVVGWGGLKESPPECEWTEGYLRVWLDMGPGELGWSEAGIALQTTPWCGAHPLSEETKLRSIDIPVGTALQMLKEW